MAYERREGYVPFQAGDYIEDGLVSVVKTEWAASKLSVDGSTDALRVTLREHMGGLEDHPGDMPTNAMRYMAVYCADPDDTILSCKAVKRYWHDGSWHKVFDVRIEL